MSADVQQLEKLKIRLAKAVFPEFRATVKS
jgi:hypothetical protein